MVIDLDGKTEEKQKIDKHNEWNNLYINIFTKYILLMALIWFLQNILLLLLNVQYTCNEKFQIPINASIQIKAKF